MPPIITTSRSEEDRIMDELRQQGEYVLDRIPVEGEPVVVSDKPFDANIYRQTPSDQELRFRWNAPIKSQGKVGFEGGSNYSWMNTSFSGCDIRAIANARGQLKVFAEMQTLSYSIHREKVPVRVLGRVYPKSYCRGPRTIAGSLVFTIFDRQALWDLVQLYRSDKGLGPEAIKTPLVDQLPPFDITVTFDNEYGHHSYMRIYGIEIIDEGQTHSIDDMITENVMSYVARDIEMMVPTSADAWGKEGKILYNRGLFFANKMGESQMNAANVLLRDINTLRGLSASASTAAERESARRKLVLLQKKLNQVMGGEMMIRRASINDHRSAYDIPYDYSTWSPKRVRDYDSSLEVE